MLCYTVVVFFKFILFLAVLGLLLLLVGFSLVVVSRATLHCGARASHCGGLSCCGARALGAQASVIVAHGLSSCGSRA